MSPGKVRAATIVHRSALVDEMLRGIAALPLDSLAEFSRDRRDVAAAESYLRRALEGLFDLARHILAKGVGQGVLEYKQVAVSLQQADVLDVAHGAALVEMAGYRNRLVHFYDEVTTPELYEICARRATDVSDVRDALLTWLRRHPETVDGEL